MKSRSSVREQLEHNAVAHDLVARDYDEKHSEIYNAVEQNRLETTIDELLRLTDVIRPEVLDFGAGTGNLSLKFAARNCRVTAVDVSARSLERLLERVAAPASVSVRLLDGDRIPFDDASYDVVATYSVLHHVPDYLGAVKEMARLLRPGGVLFIDHEANDVAWQPSASLVAYWKLTKPTPLAHLWKLIRAGEFFTINFAKTAFIKALINRRYEREGDLHVWPDDRIEWAKIETTLRDAGLSVIRSHEYLLYRPPIEIELYRQYAKTCADTRYLMATKAVK